MLTSGYGSHVQLMRRSIEACFTDFATLPTPPTEKGGLHGPSILYEGQLKRPVIGVVIWFERLA